MEHLLTKEKEWKNKLSSVVTERITKLCKKYNIQSEYKELYDTTLLRMQNIIDRNESYYFLESSKKVKSKSGIGKLLNADVSVYYLDTKKVYKKLNEYIIYPLVLSNEFIKLSEQHNRLEGDYKSLNNEHSVSINKLKKKRKKKSESYPIVKGLRETIDPTIKKTVSRLISENIDYCYFLNGNINFTELGRRIGTTYHTAKKYYDSIYILRQ